ncbi:MAG: ABC transporter permease subunit [Candidatus Thermoplasmatota archaeon]|nr:ABC transporter permease subunit [Candidatus Thermoplasmatota archaeon]
MKEKAQVSEKFREFRAELTSRPSIVLGMGLRGFLRLLSLKNQWNIALVALIWLWTLGFYVLLSTGDYPCENLFSDSSEDFKRCQPLIYYNDLGIGGVRLFLVTLAAISSSGLIANDMTDKSLHLYLSRPISRLDYLIARFIPVFLLLVSVTVVPNILVYINQWGDAGLELDWIKNHKWLLFDIIILGCFYSASYSIIGLTFSTAINRESWAAGAFFLFVYGSAIIIEFFHLIIDDDRVLLLSIIHLLDIIGFYIFDTQPFFTVFGIYEGIDIADIEVFGVFILIIGSCGLFVNWMISQMEANK